MESERWQLIEDIFHAAQQHHANDREVYLTSVCGEDKELRDEVESLISSFELTGDFLERPQLSAGLKIYADHGSKSLAGESIGPYLLESLIGSGGMGDVYLARDQRLGRLVALKILPTSFSQNLEWMLRFQQEARAASSISHPNVAHIYEFGQVEDRYYLAMEYVEGKTLRELLKERAIDPQQALDIALQIGQALQAAHEAGVVHRDIKPDNIMLRRDGYVKVLDFGLAKLTRTGLLPEEPGNCSDSTLDTKPGVIMGTPSYMSPEQVRGNPVDERTDLWSLGVTLYEMLTGHRPFEGGTPSDISAAILLGAPEHLLLDNVSGETGSRLAEILSKALDKEVNQRYLTAAAIVDDLRCLKLSSPQTNSLSARTSDAISVLQTPSKWRAFQWTSRSVRMIINNIWGSQNRLRKTVVIVVLAVLLTVAMGISATYFKQRRTSFRPDPNSLVYVFYYEYEYFPEPGKRWFLRNADGFWVERQSNGNENVFKTVGQISTGETNGLLIRNIRTNLELVVPDKEGANRKLFFRVPPVQRWTHLGDVIYETDPQKPTAEKGP
jgi:serine/threonine protein kinase